MMRILMTFLGAAVAMSAHAAPSLESVVGEPVAAEGMSAAQIADRAAQCLKSASDNVADKVDPARDGDNVYAIVLTATRGAMLTELRIRSRMTVFAKDGRFKIASTEIEQFNEMGGGWMPIYMHMGGGSKQAKAALEARAQKVSECITKKTEAPGGDNW